MKKILLLIPLLFSLTYAVETTYNDPIYSDLVNGTPSGGGIFPNNPIGYLAGANPAVTATAFCADFGASLVSYNITLVGLTSIVTWEGALWASHTTSGANRYTDIVCDIPPVGVEGCMDVNSINYDASATIDNGSCSVCSQSTLLNCSQVGCGTVDAQWINDQCLPNTLGCTDPSAENYNSSANTGNPEQYCIYCSVSAPQNCSSESTCSLVGGTWLVDSCSADLNGPASSFDGEIIVKPPNEPSWSVTAPVSVNYFSAFEQKCIGYNSSNLCDSWRWDIKDEFLEFLVEALVDTLTYFFWLFVLFYLIVRVFYFVKTLAFGK